MDEFREKLDTLRPEPITGRMPLSQQLVLDYAKEFRLDLPKSYADFLAAHGGLWISATCPIQEPCPCGTATCIQSFYGFMTPDRKNADIRWQTKLLHGAPAIIPIADGPFGSMLCLKCEGDDYGAVYLFDGEQRCFWPDEQFHRMFENLAPEIAEYLELRERGELPEKPPGYENFYRVADSFEEFLQSCQPAADDGPPAAVTDISRRWSIVDLDAELAVGESSEEIDKAIARVPLDANTPNTIVELRAPGQRILSFGIASSTDGDNSVLSQPLACILFTAGKGPPRAIVPVSNRDLPTDNGRPVVFRRADGTYPRGDGQRVLAPRRQCASVDTLVRVARHLLNTGELPEWIASEDAPWAAPDESMPADTKNPALPRSPGLFQRLRGWLGM
jgi:hypothetical protein